MTRPSLQWLPSLATAAALVALAGCPADGGVTRRLPCGGTGSYQGDPATIYSYRFEHDDLGNLTLEQVSLDGAVLLTYEARYVGDQLVHEEQDGAQAYSYDVDLDDGHRVRGTFTDRSASGGGDYTITWTWAGDRIVGWQADFANPDSLDQVATVSYGDGDSFTQVTCHGDAGCDTAVGEGAYDRWTSWRTDLDSDGVIDREARATYDRHGLMLTYERDERDDQGVLAPSRRSSYVREDDGTALRYRSEAFGDAPWIWRLEYDFCGDDGDGGGGECATACDLSSPDPTAVCPIIIKECPFGTIEVQQCSGQAGQGCCAETADQVVCPSPAAAGETISFEADGADVLMTFTPME